MSAPVDALAVLARHVSLAEQVACREQRAEAHALFDAIAELIEAVRGGVETRTHNGFVMHYDEVQADRLAAALRAVSGEASHG
jgi:hypothetical protein